MDEDEARRRVTGAPVARLATLDSTGRPTIVPICTSTSAAPAAGIQRRGTNRTSALAASTRATGRMCARKRPASIQSPPTQMTNAP